LLMKAKGWPSCSNTAPTHLLEAYVSIQKGLEKLGIAKTGAETKG
jgi:hypothetical protein